MKTAPRVVATVFSASLPALALALALAACGSTQPAGGGAAPAPEDHGAAASCEALTWDAEQQNATDAAYVGTLAETEATDANDQPETFYVLTLDRPVCLPGDAPAAGEVQVYSADAAVRDALAAAVGKRVRVAGPAFVAMTAHHHRPLVIEAVTLKDVE